MGFEFKANAVNQIPKGTELFLENEPAAYVGVIIRGRVLARSESVKLTLPAGSFLGVFDLSVGHYVFDYVASLKHVEIPESVIVAGNNLFEISGAYENLRGVVSGYIVVGDAKTAKDFATSYFLC